VLRDKVYLTEILPAGSRRVDRYPEFVHYLRSLPRTEVGLHGLHHVHRGPLIHVEFQNESQQTHIETLGRMLDVFDRSGLQYVRGMCPPGWNAPPALLGAMGALGFDFVASARDIRASVADDAVTSMSGISGVSLIHPAWLAQHELVHFTTNFQATSPLERAIAIIEAGGVLSIKGHIIKDAMGFVALDGIDGVYCNFLDLLFRELRRRYGDELWWTTMGEMARRIRGLRGELAAS
jgi:hypothetical protein